MNGKAVKVLIQQLTITGNLPHRSWAVFDKLLEAMHVPSVLSPEYWHIPGQTLRAKRLLQAPVKPPITYLSVQAPTPKAASVNTESGGAPLKATPTAPASDAVPPSTTESTNTVLTPIAEALTTEPTPYNE